MLLTKEKFKKMNTQVELSDESFQLKIHFHPFNLRFILTKLVFHVCDCWFRLRLENESFGGFSALN